MQQIDDAEAGSSRLWLPHSSTTETGASQLSNKVQKKNRLKKILKKLSLLKLIKQADRRILRLRVLASRCWKLLTFKKPASLAPGPAGTRMSPMEPKKPGVDADTSPVVNTTTETDSDITDSRPWRSSLRFRSGGPVLKACPSGSMSLPPRCSADQLSSDGSNRAVLGPVARHWSTHQLSGTGSNKTYFCPSELGGN
ncbi:hypothetical protein Y1Q_0002800 [Alligator mississippiensis]|uniref:Uncharacterized protein n=1 Tax=Alligator mississippiensis TaxID=8496 RepID=A0A151P0K4_ALLMI|nr:hypothetical protein Y1Q_0002800 [Alligator mississippiensis]